MASEDGGTDQLSWALIEHAGRRVHGLCAAVIDAFDHDADPGGLDPWTPEYHAAAAEVYPLTLSATYLDAVAEAFVGIAQLMELVAAPVGAEDDWSLVATYLRNAGTAMGGTGTDDPPIKIVTQATPSVMRVDLLAAIGSEHGWRQLAHACLGVVGATRMQGATDDVPDLADRLEAIETTLSAISSVTRSHRPR